MSTPPVLHHKARGVHPGAVVQDTAPDPVALGLQDHVLWVDTSSGPPYALKVWDATSSTWQAVGVVFTGTLPADCLTFPHTATICNPSTDEVTLSTPTGTFSFDATGIALPQGHRLESAWGPL